jgi:hypothetical protein
MSRPVSADGSSVIPSLRIWVRQRNPNKKRLRLLTQCRFRGLILSHEELAPFPAFKIRLMPKFFRRLVAVESSHHKAFLLAICASPPACGSVAAFQFLQANCRGPECRFQKRAKSFQALRDRAARREAVRHRHSRGSAGCSWRHASGRRVGGISRHRGAARYS